MPIELKPVPYGAQAARALHAAVVTAKAGDALAPVTVVVPTNYVGVAARRLLGSGVLGRVTEGGDGVAGVTFLTAFRLGELLGAPKLAAAHRRPVSIPVPRPGVRAVLADAPGRFRPVAEHPATEAALVAAHRELSNLDDAALDALVRTGARAADVVRISRRVRASLAADWYDERDLMDAAAAEVTAGAPLLADLGALVVFLPQELSTPAAALLRALATRVPVTVVAGTTGDTRADAPVRAAMRARLDLEVPDADVAASPRQARRRGWCRRRIPTTKCAPSCGWSSTRPATACPSNAWPCSTARPIRTRAWCTSTSRPRASRTTAPPSAPSPRACSAARCSDCSRSPTATSNATT